MLACIPKLQATKIINALRGDGLAKMAEMKTSAERREFLMKYIGDKGMASKVNAEFEKALVKNTKEAMADFARKLVDGTPQQKKDVFAKIAELDEKKLFDGDIYEDYISDFLEAKITTKDVEAVRKISANVTEATKRVESEYKKVLESGEITPEYEKALVEQAKAIKAGDEFMVEAMDTAWSSTIYNHAKALMLTNPASWGVNVISNLVNGGMTAIERRVGNFRLTGYNRDLARQWKNTMLNVRNETGYDMSRALSYDDLLQKRVMGETPSIGRDSMFTRAIYNRALGTPDAWAARMAFADALNLDSSSTAHALGFTGNEAAKKSRELFLDAMQLIPKTELGRELRQRAVLEAQIATWTNKGLISKMSLGLKHGLDKMTAEVLGSKAFKPGELIAPFVVTLANIAQRGIDASGWGALKGLFKMKNALLSKKYLTPVQFKKEMGDAFRDISVSGIGLAGVVALASLIDTDDFVGAYDPNRWKYEQLRNSNSNSIRIGDKWYSLDYFGALAAPLIAALYAKKYGNDNLGQQVIQGALGGVDQLTSNIPVVSALGDMYATVQRDVNPDDPNASKKVAKTIWNTFTDQVTSRVPGLLTNVVKLFDPYEREANGFWENLQAKTGILRGKLPVKQDMIGQDVLTELGRNANAMDRYIATFTQVFAGARVKTAKDDPVGNEIIRLKDSGNAASFTSWKYRLGERQTRLKEKVGEEKYRAIYRDEYGKKVVEKTEKLIKTERYKKMTDKEKADELSRIDDEVIKNIYDRYNITLRESNKTTTRKSLFSTQGRTSIFSK